MCSTIYSVEYANGERERSNVKCRLFQGAERPKPATENWPRNYPTQETGGELGDIDEDDEVPGQ